MSINIVNKVTGTSTTSATSFNTIAIDITAGQTYLLGIAAGVPTGNTVNVSSITAANNVTWAIVGTACAIDTDVDRLYLFKGICTGSVTGASWTVNTGGGTGREYVYTIDEVSGSSGNLVQNVKSESDQTSPISATLSAFGNSNNIPYAVGGVEYQSGLTITQESGWTALGGVVAHNGTDYVRILSAWKTSPPDTSPSFTFSGYSTGMIAVEIESIIAVTGFDKAKTTDTGVLTQPVALLGVSVGKSSETGLITESIPLAGQASAKLTLSGDMATVIAGNMKEITKDQGTATLTLTLSANAIAKTLTQGSITQTQFLTGADNSITKQQGDIGGIIEPLSGQSKNKTIETGAVSESFVIHGDQSAKAKATDTAQTAVTIANRTGATKSSETIHGSASETTLVSGQDKASARDTGVSTEKQYMTGSDKAKALMDGAGLSETLPISGQDKSSSKDSGALNENKLFTGAQNAKSADSAQLSEQLGVTGQDKATSRDTGAMNDTVNAQGLDKSNARDTGTASETIGITGTDKARTTDAGLGVRADVLSGSMSGKATDAGNVSLSFTVSGQSLAKALDTGVTQPRIRSLSGNMAARSRDIGTAQIIPIPLTGSGNAHAIDRANLSTSIGFSGASAAVDKITGAITVTVPKIALSGKALNKSADGGNIQIAIPLSVHALANAMDIGALDLHEINAAAWKAYRIKIQNRLW